jgi:hypothetical protein
MTTTAVRDVPRPSSATAQRFREQFLALGPIAEAFLRAAAAAGTSKLATELAAICELEASWGREPLIAALERAVTFRRFRASDIRSILDAGSSVPIVVAEGEALVLDLPAVPLRSLDAYRLEALG